MVIRHAKGVICNHVHNMEVTKLSLVTCPACKYQLDKPEVFDEFKKLENAVETIEKQKVKNLLKSTISEQEERNNVRYCPKCYSSMRLRKNSKNGNYFWGCSNYPKCKITKEADI